MCLFTSVAFVKNISRKKEDFYNIARNHTTPAARGKFKLTRIRLYVPYVEEDFGRNQFV